MKTYALMVLVAMFAFGSVPVFADEGPKIGGNAKIEISGGTVQQNVAAAIGNESRADQSVLSMTSGEVGGNLELSLTGGTIQQNVSAAIGNETETHQSIGSIGK